MWKRKTLVNLDRLIPLDDVAKAFGFDGWNGQGRNGAYGYMVEAGLAVIVIGKAHYTTAYVVQQLYDLKVSDLSARRKKLEADDVMLRDARQKLLAGRTAEERADGHVPAIEPDKPVKEPEKPGKPNSKDKAVDLLRAVQDRA